MIPCVATTRTTPRALQGHHTTECDTPDCPGCQPCPELHCVVCDTTHVPGGACPGCVGKVRDQLQAVARLCDDLPAAAMESVRRHGGVESEAAMLWGPVADPEAFGHVKASAEAGRIDPGFLEDCHDEKHPLWVLGTWEQAWRDHLDHFTDDLVTLEGAVDYLDRQLAYMAGLEEPAFDRFARDVAGCLRHLEDVLHDGVREETGAPCPECGRALVKRYGDRAADDRWECRAVSCGVRYSDMDYRLRVSSAYRANADRLNAADFAAEYGVPRGSLTAWAATGRVRRRGKDESGRQLYDVADVKTVLASKEFLANALTLSETAS